MALRILQASVAKTAAFAGASMAIGATEYPLGRPDWVITLNVKALTAGASATFAVYDSVDAFTAKIPRALFSVVGSINAAAPVAHSWTKINAWLTRFGTTDAVLRIELVELTGTSPSVTYDAYLNDAL